MRTSILIGGVLAFLCVAHGAGGAGEKKDLADFIEKPGPEHKILEKMAGTWEASVKLYMEAGKDPNLSKGTMTRKMFMDGRFLKEEYNGEFDGGAFTGLGILGYDIKKKNYVATWVDSMTTGIMMSSGAYDADKKTFTFSGESMLGKIKVTTRDVLRLVSDDEQVMEMNHRPEGAKDYFKVMEITYKRKKS